MKKYSLYIVVFFIVLVFIGFIIIDGRKIREYSNNLFYMDTYINVKIYSNKAGKARDALKEVDKIYKDYHELTDRYKEYSDVKNIYYINHKLEINNKLVIDKDLYDLLEYSIDICQDSKGLLNIAMGNVIDVWKQYRDGVKIGVPTIEELTNSGSNNLDDIVLENNNVIYKKSGISIDLGAFAKGYATEKVGQYLESIGFDKYIINAGGNVKVGKHYNEGDYKIGIEKPTKDGGIYQIIKGHNIAVTTSGSYERFYEYNGINYHHIIDPYTLFPPNYMLSVTIVSKDSTLADALDTMLFMMPIDEGMEYINKMSDVEAIWYGMDGYVYYSEGFSKYE